MILLPELDVLAVARLGDKHGDEVVRALRGAGARVARLGLNSLRFSELSWSLTGHLTFGIGGERYQVREGTTVWWRRPGRVEVRDLNPAEGALVREESRHLFLGALYAQHPRWIDPPADVGLAELKPRQLKAARALGIPTPDTIVTNDLATARSFASEGPVLAKASSSGEGLAPYAQVVTREALELVQTVPVLLQRVAPTIADIRVITVGNAAVAWQRPRDIGQPIDWRAVDPTGADFKPSDAHPDLVAGALRLDSVFGLSHTVQDWLLTESGFVFLEMNPVGQWLFLAESKLRILPALVKHLTPSV